MRSCNRIRRALAWTLIVAMAHPSVYAQVPPNGVGDFTLYTSTSSSGASEPNILMIIDTSDSMNIPEAWREYSGDYDSHVEYLWNDLNRIVDADIGSAGEAVAEEPGRISTAAQSQSPTSPWGFWAGATLAERQALWQAARSYAKATQAGDPGPRSVWRNYDDLSWIYWLPAGTSEDDARLRSPSWNRFRGAIKTLGGIRASIDFGGSANDYRSYNQCSSSLDALTPSTIFAPADVVQNGGKYLAQQWLRWEPWSNLTTVGNDDYPGNSAVDNILTTSAIGYLEAKRDDFIGFNPNGTKIAPNAGTPAGSNGLPIRYDSGSAGATWSDPRADLGGFNFRSVVDGYNAQASLDEIKSWYGLPATSDIDASGASDLKDSKFIAWKGNRDANPAFGLMTGVPAYADATPAACDALTGPQSATCLKKPGLVTPAVTVTKASTCTLAGTNTETDAWNYASHYTYTWGGSCNLGAITCNDPNGAGTPPDCNNVADPVCAAPTGNIPQFYDKILSGCAWSGGTTLNVSNCALQNVQSLTVPVCQLQGTGSVAAPNCAMTGQTAINVGACALQGQSNVFVAACSPVGGNSVSVAACAPTGGGTVTVAACAPTGGGAVTVNACSFQGRQTATVGSCDWHGRNSRKIEGVGWYAYGGSCQESGSSANCSASGTTILGHNLAVGFFNSSNAAENDTSGCTNTVPAGTVYNYGGSCRESGSTASCQVTGGITATIGGDSYDHVNGSCGNVIASGSYTFGISCKENNSTASCSTSAGSSMTIRGTTYTGVGATCSNTVLQGNYTFGISCQENGSAASCATSAGSSLTIRGTSYTGIGATCSNTVAAGLYGYGYTCQENGAATNCSTGAGSSMNIRGQQYNGVGATCSNTVAPGGYTLGGTCQESGSPLSCSTSAGSALTIGGVNRSDVNRTCTQVQGIGSYLTGGACSPGGASCTYVPGNIINIRGTNYGDFGATCSNVGSGPGSYTVGGTGCATNPAGFEANCTYNPGSDITIGGVVYSHYGASCTNIVAAGAYSYGGDSCSGTAGNCTYNGGSTLTVAGTPYQHQNASCSNIVAAGAYQYGQVCQGTLIAAQPVATPGGAATTTVNTAAACDVAGTSTLIVGGTTYGTYGGSCATKSPWWHDQTCLARYGANCNPSCAPPAATSFTGGGGTGADAYFRVYNLAGSTDYLVHDCKADEPAANPGSNSYMRGTIPLRTLGTAFDNAKTSPLDITAPYTTNPGQAVAADDGKKIDMISVNYLNWKFGPKGPNGNPIGRKSRLQIAKDALTGLVSTTNGVRFGLMVFNKTANAANNYSDEGGNIVYKITTMGPKNCSLASASTTGSISAGSSALTLTANPDFGIGNSITIPGAGNAGSDLTANIANIVVTTVAGVEITTVTLSASASTSVANATINVPACTADEQTAYANRLGLINTINSLSAASRTPLTESLYEAYLYFRGEAPLFGRLATPADKGGAVAAGCDKSAFTTPGIGADCTGSSGNYVSPMMSSIDPNTGQPAACSKNFVIMMTDGGPEDDISANALIKALSYNDPNGSTIATSQGATASHQFESGGSPYGPIDSNPDNQVFDGGYVWLDELAYYMANADMNTAISGRQPVNTYTIGFAGADSAVLSNAAAKGNGQYYVATTAGALSAALTAAVAAIREWNPTLAAPTIPISALNRSESAAEVYLAYFGPASNQAWSGTVKKFRLGQGSSECGTNADSTAIDLCLIGKTVLSGATVKNIEQVTVNPLTGEQTVIVNPAAVSFWNPGNIQDSSHPNKGGTGQALVDSATMNPSTRKVYTFITDPGAGGEAVSVSTNLSDNAVSESSTLVTKARLGDAAMSEAQRATLINFIRGGNTSVAACTDAPAAGTACASWRGWPHSDVMHSKPAIVTYDPTPVADAESGASRPSSQYLFYLSNDGLLHAINAADGQEAWSFLVEEALAQIHAINDNLAGQHLTLADGAPTAWVFDSNGDGKIDSGDGDKAYLYFGLRRGGRAYYALDISNVSSPQFMWKIDRRPGGGVLCNTSCAAAGAYDELGYTWSVPIAGRVRALAAAGVPALIFGGGYDGNQDNFSATAADAMGRAVYVVNGLTGSPLKVFKNGQGGAIGGGSISGMDFSIPSTVTALNTDFDSLNLLDRVYVGDMAANLWRFDINDGAPANWTAKQLATLSNGFSLPATIPNRKIMTPPVVVKQSYQGQNYDAVYVGSGDREHPLVTNSADKMFMIKDNDLGLTAANGNPVALSDLYDISAVFLESDLDPATFKAKSGWFQSLLAGEKLFSQPSVFYNVLRYSTFNPTASLSACLPPGKGTLYAIDARYGGSVANSTTVAPSTTTKQDPGISTGGTRGTYSDPSLVFKKSGGSTEVYRSFCHDGTCSFQKLGTVGGATKMYWYRESAR